MLQSFRCDTLPALFPHFSIPFSICCQYDYSVSHIYIFMVWPVVHSQTSVSNDSSNFMSAVPIPIQLPGLEGREMGSVRNFKIPSCGTCTLTRKAYPKKDASSGEGRRTFII